MNRYLVSIAAVVVAWAGLQFFFTRPASIVDDWMGWRQADTQTVARNFLEKEANILYPRINWGGDGPGYAESEFQIYPAIIARIMRITGDVEWPGQVLSLLFMAATAVILSVLLAGQFGQSAALFGVLAFVTSQGAVHLSTSVQPDAMALMLYTAGLAVFLRFTETERPLWLVLNVACMALAAVIKPTALSLGIIQFLYVLIAKPGLLKRPALWFSWLMILALTGLFMAHAYDLYRVYGKTFGILAGDSKFPTLRSLVTPLVYAKLLYMIAAWGMGIAGIASALFLAWRRRLQALDLALTAGYVIGLLVALRYTTNRGYGPHYHMFGMVLGAWLVAHAYHELEYRPASVISIRSLAAIMSVFFAVQYGVHVYFRHNADLHIQKEVSVLGRELARHAKKDDLVVLKSVASSVSEELWGRRTNNYEDPRVFYLAHVRGWVVPWEKDNFELIKQYAARGARFYVEPRAPGRSAELYEWLGANAEVLYSGTAGRIYLFR